MRLRILPLWMARPREGHPFGDHTIQFAGVERPPVPWRISPVGRCRARVSVSIVVHSGRVPSESLVHGSLVDTFSAGV